MKCVLSIRRILVAISVVSILCLFLLCNSEVQAQAIFSFEDGIEPWTSPSGVNLKQSSFGATDGTSALLFDDLTAGYKGNTASSLNFGPSTPGMGDAFEAFALAASVSANGGTPILEFDFSWDFSQASNGGYIQLGLQVNSSTLGETPEPGGFRGLGTGQFINGGSDFSSWPSLGPGATTDGAVLTMTGANSAHVAVPFAPDKSLSISSPSTFYCAENSAAPASKSMIRHIPR